MLTVEKSEMMRSRLLGLIVAIVVAVTGCGRTSRMEIPETAPPQEGPRPDSEQWDAVIHLFEEGDTQAVIEAEYMAVFQIPDNDHTRLDTLQVDFFDEEGTVSSHLVADSGEIYNQDREGRRSVKTWGGVMLTGTEGRTVRADTLWWDEEMDQVYTDGPVEVTREGELLRGIKFRSDTRLEKMTFEESSGYSLQGGEWLEEERRTETEPDSAVAVPDTVRVPPPDTSRIPP